MHGPPRIGRDPTDVQTVDLEAWISAERRRRADRLRAAHPDLPMVQLPLELHPRGMHRAPRARH